MEQTAYLNKPLREGLTAVLEAVKPRKILLVCGQTSYERSGAEAICEDAFLDTRVVTFCGFSPNPTLEEVTAGVAAWQETRPDLVVAVGGGSALDIAKAVNALAVQTEGEASEYVRGERELTSSNTPVLAIPTTAGSGAEATHFAVVYIDGRKYSFAHESLLPDYAIIDPALLFSQSSQQRAVSGLDALAQSIESLWSKSATDESREYAKEALTLVYKNLLGFVNGDDTKAPGMAKGSHLAGKAIDISKTTASHAVSYPLTMHYGIPHGHAVGLTLPALLEFNAPACSAVVAEISNAFGANTPADTATAIRNLMTEIGLPTDLKDHNITEGDLPGLIEEMSIERANNNPRPFTAEDAERILRALI